MTSLVYVADTADVLRSQPIMREIAGVQLLVCAVGDRFYVVENKCSHMAKSLTGGRQIGYRLVCPHHSGQFDIRDGSPQCFPVTKPIKTYNVVVNAGAIWIPEQEFSR